MKQKSFLAAIALAAAGVGAGLWWLARPEPQLAAPSIAPGAIWAASFEDPAGGRHALGELRARVLVVNFWATWCVPCREEMPAFRRLQDRWQAKGVRFVGLANDEPAKVERFGRELAINYPLWVGGERVSELSRRLGNRLGVLPHTVILDPDGQILDAKVGPYTEPELDAKLLKLAANR